MEKIVPVELYYEQTGDGLPVILLHGFPLDHTIWYEVAGLLECKARFILPDLRGHGRSPAPEGIYTMRTMVEDVIALMDRLNLPAAVLVGHSLGGYVALDFARAYPARLLGMALIASHALPDTPERKAVRLKNARSILRYGVRKHSENLAPRLTNRSDIAEKVLPIMLKTTPAGMAGALKGMAERPDSTELLQRISVPSVIIYGDKDALVPTETAETMERLLSRGWRVQISGASHIPMLEEPAAVADALCQLFRAVEGN